MNSAVDFLSSVPNANPMASTMARTDVTNPSTEDWVNVFGPSGYNVQPDNTRNRKLGRVHLPDVLKVIDLFQPRLWQLTRTCCPLLFLVKVSVFIHLPLCLCATGSESMDHRPRRWTHYRRDQFALYNHNPPVHVYGLSRPKNRMECVDI